MTILFLSPDYPDTKSSDFSFVKQLVDEIARLGHTCVVVSPFSIVRKKRIHKYITRKIVGNGKILLVRPNILTFSNFHIGSFYLSIFCRSYAIKLALRQLKIKPDVVYCHFWELGMDGVKYASKCGIKCFVASGESVIPKFSNQYIDYMRKYITGVICVSTKNRDESVQAGLTTINKCKVIPNAVNSSLFKVINREKCRKSLGIKTEDFVISYVGWFDERKGIKRVEQALNGINNDIIHSIFIGSGNLEPTVANIVFKGKLQHNEIPFYLNASDVFVLPTLKEGCCNAIVEAMSCGLPIISSNLSFNWDVLDSSNSIMVDPTNIKDIRDAILVLKRNKEKREVLKKGALSKAKKLTIENRAKDIIQFIQENC